MNAHSCTYLQPTFTEYKISFTILTRVHEIFENVIGIFIDVILVELGETYGGNTGLDVRVNIATLTYGGNGVRGRDCTYTLITMSKGLKVKGYKYTLTPVSKGYG